METERLAPAVAKWLDQTGIALGTLRQILIDRGCEAVFAFGSTVRGDATQDSDIDIAVVGGTHPNLAPLTANQPLDVHSWSTIPLRLRFAIVREGLCIFESKPGTAAALRRRVRRAWARKAEERQAALAAELRQAVPLG
jgi:predicted nucleotidyltransferase